MRRKRNAAISMLLMTAVLLCLVLLGCDGGDVNPGGCGNTDPQTDTDTDTGTRTLELQENSAGFCRVDGTIDNNNTGFTGNGFANTTNAAGSAILWAVDAEAAGNCTLTWRYANGGGSSRSGSILINGSAVGNTDFSATGAWDSWTETAPVQVRLSDGINRISLRSTHADGLANIDLMTISGRNLSPGDCNAASPGGDLSDITVYIAGDSTVSNYANTASPRDQAGWGQMLQAYYNNRVTVENRARGGRTALWFALEGEVDRILSSIKFGDYFLIQFGTNDSHPTATFTVNGRTYQRYADPDTDFKDHLMRYYITPTRQRGGIPVLVTPPPRNSAYCTGGNSLARWAQAMRELGAANNVTVVDLNQKTVDHLIGICPPPTPENFFMIRPDGTVDGTHFQENGARILAGFVAQGIAEAGLGLAAYER